MDLSRLKHFMGTQSFRTSQANAVLDGRQPAMFAGSTSAAKARLESGFVCVPWTGGLFGEIRVSARRPQLANLNFNS